MRLSPFVGLLVSMNLSPRPPARQVLSMFIFVNVGFAIAFFSLKSNNGSFGAQAWPCPPFLSLPCPALPAAAAPPPPGGLVGPGPSLLVCSWSVQGAAGDSFDVRSIPQGMLNLLRALFSASEAYDPTLYTGNHDPRIAGFIIFLGIMYYLFSVFLGMTLLRSILEPHDLKRDKGDRDTSYWRHFMGKQRSAEGGGLGLTGGEREQSMPGPSFCLAAAAAAGMSMLRLWETLPPRFRRHMVLGDVIRRPDGSSMRFLQYTEGGSNRGMGRGGLESRRSRDDSRSRKTEADERRKQTGASNGLLDLRRATDRTTTASTGTGTSF